MLFIYPENVQVQINLSTSQIDSKGLYKACMYKVCMAGKKTIGVKADNPKN